MFRQQGNNEAQYWIARNRLRSEFGLTAEEADNEPAEEAAIHFAIWRFQSEYEEKEAKRAEAKNRVQ